MSDTVRTRRAASYKEAISWVANFDGDVTDETLARFVSEVFKRDFSEVVEDVKGVLNPKPRGRRGRPAAEQSAEVPAETE